MNSKIVTNKLTATRENGIQLLPPIVSQHLIRLINDGVLQATQGQDMGTKDKVLQATGSSDKNVTALSEQSDLLPTMATAIDDTGSKHGSGAKLASLIEDLYSKLTSWDHDEHQGLNLDIVNPSWNVFGLGRLAPHFFAFPVSLDRMGIR